MNKLICLTAILLLANATTLMGKQVWYDTASPGFGMSVPSTANGNVVYSYTFCGGVKGASFFPVFTDVYAYTYENATVNGSNVSDKGTGTKIGHAIRQHCNEAILTGSTTNYTDSSTGWWDFVTDADDIYFDHGSVTRTTITGSGVSNSWYDSGTYTIEYYDNSGCNEGYVTTIRGVYLEVHLELAQGAAIPSLPSIGNPFGRVIQEEVGITSKSNASDNYYGGTYSGGFYVRRCDSVHPLTVNISWSGTATYGSDYYSNYPSSIYFAAGQTAKWVSVNPYYDPLDGNETVILTITGGAYATPALSCYPNSKNQDQITIFNN